MQPSPKILQKQAYLQESPPSFPTPILTLCEYFLIVRSDDHPTSSYTYRQREKRDLPSISTDQSFCIYRCARCGGKRRSKWNGDASLKIGFSNSNFVAYTTGKLRSLSSLYRFVLGLSTIYRVPKFKMRARSSRFDLL